MWEIKKIGIDRFFLNFFEVVVYFFFLFIGFFNFLILRIDVFFF